MTLPAPAPLFVALDVPEVETALSLAERLGPVNARFKVGPFLFLKGGPELIRRLTGDGYEIFLDLKLHDIPAVVAGGVRRAAELGAAWLTIHASGGPAMVRAAAEASAEEGGPKLLAVTVLTSLSGEDLQRMGVLRPLPEQAEALAKLAVGEGAHGIVCSAQEAARLREALGPGPTLVCPGIRPEGSAAQDQKRIATPKAAIAAGASLLVVGRPVIAAEDPEAALRSLLDSMG
jgi:orotidine-5'-phosphate decarboxylase